MKEKGEERDEGREEGGRVDTGATRDGRVEAASVESIYGESGNVEAGRKGKSRGRGGKISRVWGDGWLDWLRGGML